MDEGIFIETKNNKRILHLRSGKFPARTLQEELPDSMNVSDFDLQEHVELLTKSANATTEFAL